MIGNVILPVLPVFFFDCVLYIFHFNKLVSRASGTEMLVHLLIAVRVRTLKRAQWKRSDDCIIWGLPFLRA